MITNKNELKEYLEYERDKYSISKGIKHVLKYIIGAEKDVIWNYQKRLRITEYHYNSKHKARYFANKIFLNHKANKYGLRISLNVFDKGLKIMHLGSILTNKNARVGKDCSIHTNTAIVAQGRDDGVPIIGNHVVICTGAVILGNITIADNIIIGANSVVNKNFNESDIAIAGVPAKKISDNGKTKWKR